MSAGFIEIDVMVHHWTEKAVLVSTDGDEKQAVWIPRSLCTFESVLLSGETQTVKLTERTAIEKGLV